MLKGFEKAYALSLASIGCGVAMGALAVGASGVHYLAAAGLGILAAVGGMLLLGKIKGMEKPDKGNAIELGG